MTTDSPTQPTGQENPPRREADAEPETAGSTPVAGAGVGANTLFDLELVRMDSPRLRAIKEHNIQTHHAPQMEEAPWMAIPMTLAKERAEAYLEGDEDSIASITASAGILLEDAGLIFYGTSQTEVEDAAILFCKANAKHQARP